MTLNVQLTAEIFYPLALALGAEALVSITRVEELLLMEEKEESKEKTFTPSAITPMLNKKEKDVNDEEKNLLPTTNGELKEMVKNKGRLIFVYTAPLLLTET